MTGKGRKLAAQCPAAPELPPVQRQLRLSRIDMKVTCPRSSPTELSQQQSSCSCVRPCNIAAACPLHVVEALASEAGTTPQRRDDGPQNSVFGFETGVGSGRPWPDPAGDLGGVECCLAHHSEMSLVVHRRVDAGIKSIGWNLDVWTKVGQRPISKFQNDANLGRQLGTFATGPDRRWLNDVLGEGKEAPRFNGKIRRCSPVLLFSCPG